MKNYPQELEIRKGKLLDFIFSELHRSREKLFLQHVCDEGERKERVQWSSSCRSQPGSSETCLAYVLAEQFPSKRMSAILQPGIPFA